MKKKRRRIRWNNVFLFLLIIIFIIVFIYSLIKLFDWLNDSKKSSNSIDIIQRYTNVTEIDDSNNTEIINNEELDETNPYWDYIKMNLIDVDFSELKEINESIVGWIQVSGTNINYPFVQTNNNNFYLNHTFDKSYNEAGWVFMDYRNNKSDYDKNTIIYAHGRLDNTMFGSLRKIITKKWLNNSNNFVVKISTEDENTLWQVFSVYRIPTTNDYIQVDFVDNEEFLEFANILIERSSFNFNTTINENDKIITLSTCYNDNDKVVLHAKLIKREKK